MFSIYLFQIAGMQGGIGFERLRRSGIVDEVLIKLSYFYDK